MKLLKFQQTLGKCVLGIPLNPYQGLKLLGVLRVLGILAWNSPESLPGIETSKLITIGY
ncbi:hypothetical protein MC7420_7329 [Coleofasciculus chthonoplastes PCC 7420]|uniref:Uncharacterized protein n=1 Tax=Coleofasciculus chthonoplastes PCC 7420 TaxID=118168 RepID=B4VH04_9CYAN|nr:hypothetical protein MC7420_7329 [Coleofasciculus chthonoplastes PCC 7420]